MYKTFSTGVQKWEPMKGSYKFEQKAGKKKKWLFDKKYSGGRDIYLLLTSEEKYQGGVCGLWPLGWL